MKCSRCKRFQTYKLFPEKNPDYCIKCGGMRQLLSDIARDKVAKPHKRIEDIPNIEYSKSACNILKQHRAILQDDPERMSTEFLKSIINPTCKCSKKSKPI